MQPCVIRAFRKRLKHRGYTSIFIRKSDDDNLYLVCAVEPLTKTVVSDVFSLTAMASLFLRDTRQ